MELFRNAKHYLLRWQTVYDRILDLGQSIGPQHDGEVQPDDDPK